MGLFPSPRFLAIILICSPLFFADLIGKAAPPWVGVLVLYCLLSEKETFEKAISHLKTPRGPVLQGPIKQRYLKKGTMHLTTLVFWSTKGVSLSPLQTMDAYDSHLQKGRRSYHCSLAFLPSGNHAVQLPLLLRLLRSIASEARARCSLPKEKKKKSLFLFIFCLPTTARVVTVHFTGNSTKPCLHWCQVAGAVSVHWATPLLQLP